MFAGSFPQLVITILSNINSTKAAAKQVDWAFVVLLPNYNMGNGISNLYTNYEYIDLCFDQLPNISHMAPGKESLDTLCNQYANKSMKFACCKGGMRSYPHCVYKAACPIHGISVRARAHTGRQTHADLFGVLRFYIWADTYNCSIHPLYIVYTHFCIYDVPTYYYYQLYVLYYLSK